ncbi:MAG: ribbon-helix-helix protein, CopG family, partial [Bryobacteraceae bacterium]
TGRIPSSLNSGKANRLRFRILLLCGSMKKTRKFGDPVSADAIARLADRNKDVSHFFKNQARMVQPTQRVNVDVTVGMLEELDKAARELNVSRQTVIKTLVRQALDQHYLAQ